MSQDSTTDTQQAGKALRIAFWVAQIIVALIFCGAGLFKLSAPIPDLATAMKWPGEFSPTFVRIIGLIDLLGGIGILLPALTRILPKLTILAAIGCTVLQVIAIGFHSSRGEFNVLPLNFLLLPLCLFILWGRARKAPISPRA